MALSNIHSLKNLPNAQTIWNRGVKTTTKYYKQQLSNSNLDVSCIPDISGLDRE